MTFVVVVVVVVVVVAVAVVVVVSLESTKGKEKESIYLAPFIYYVYLNALRHGSHSFTCKYTIFYGLK